MAQVLRGSGEAVNIGAAASQFAGRQPFGNLSGGIWGAGDGIMAGAFWDIGQ